jgi:hypothetical protein
MEAVPSSEMSVCFYPSTRYPIPKDNNNLHCDSVNNKEILQLVSLN